MKISVLGLGYVGSVSAACLAQKGYQVLGFDINKHKIASLNNGKATIIEPQLNELIRDSVSKGNLCGTEDINEAIHSSDISFICVGTPSKKNNKIDLHQIETVCQQIGAALKNKNDYHIIVTRSTMFPGTIKNIVIPVLEKYSNKKISKDFSVCINPEFMKEGTAVYDFFNPSQNIIAATDSRGYDTLAPLIDTVTGIKTIRLPIEVAELIKYSYNIWHAIKVCFANEIGNVCHLLGIDSHQLMDVFCQDKVLNLSPYYLKPGFAFGGSCLPKDLRAFIHESQNLQIELPIINAILPSNKLQIERALQMIIDTHHKKIGILGLSFKAETDDIRESPMLELIERLLGKGYQIRIYDKNVSVAREFDMNKTYFTNYLSHISNLLVPSIDDILDFSETIVIGNKSSHFTTIIDHIKPEQVIIDLVRIRDERPNLKQYKGICW